MSTTTVSATVRDVNGNLYAQARVAFDLVPASGTQTPANYTTQVIAYTDNGGYFSVPLTSNNSITPAGSTWSCSVISSDRTHSFIVTGLSISGVSQDISAEIQAASAQLSQVITTLGLVPVTYSATPTFNAALGSVFKITLTGNVTSSTLSNVNNGQLLTFIIMQDATGGRTFTWPADVINGVVPDVTANSKTVQSFIYEGSNAYPVGPPTIN